MHTNPLYYKLLYVLRCKRAKSRKKIKAKMHFLLLPEGSTRIAASLAATTESTKRTSTACGRTAITDSATKPDLCNIRPVTRGWIPFAAKSLKALEGCLVDAPIVSSMLLTPEVSSLFFCIFLFFCGLKSAFAHFFQIHTKLFVQYILP